MRRIIIIILHISVILQWSIHRKLFIDAIQDNHVFLALPNRIQCIYTALIHRVSLMSKNKYVTVYF